MATTDKIKIGTSEFPLTTYTLSQSSTDGHTITLSSSSGASQTVTIPDKDTITTIASTTGSGNAITSITASNGALTLVKGETFLATSGGTMTGTLTATSGLVIGSVDPKVSGGVWVG